MNANTTTLLNECCTNTTTKINMDNNSIQSHPVHQAMDFVEDSQAYQTALSKCPESVWQLEAPHDRYLQFCGDNAWEAAARMAQYWKVRTRVFGADRAYQPLGRALQGPEIDYIARGVATVPGRTRNGRAIFAVDRGRVPDQKPPLHVRERFLFVLFQMLSDVSLPQNSFENVFVLRTNPSVMGRLDKAELELMEELLSRCLCTRMTVFHILIEKTIDHAGGGGGGGGGAPRRSTLFELMLPMILQKEGKFIASTPHVFHIGTPDENLKSLLQHCNDDGLELQHLPTSHGGTYCFERDWHAKLRSYGIELPTKTTETTEATTSVEVEVPLMQQENHSSQTRSPELDSKESTTTKQQQLPLPPPKPVSLQTITNNGFNNNKSSEKETKLRWRRRRHIVDALVVGSPSRMAAAARLREKKLAFSRRIRRRSRLRRRKAQMHACMTTSAPSKIVHTARLVPPADCVVCV